MECKRAAADAFANEERYQDFIFVSKRAAVLSCSKCDHATLLWHEQKRPGPLHGIPGPFKGVLYT